MIQTGLDRLLQEPALLAGKRYGLLAHTAALSASCRPIHLALMAAGAEPPVLLLGPEHGFHAVEQDMVAASDGVDPWTGARIVSLYGETAESLRPSPDLFTDLDLLLVDLQDVGTRYYTYAASAVWATQEALAAGCEVWALDRPNPLGGVQVEGSLPEPGFDSFVGALRVPVRHGLTLGELLQLEGRRRGWGQGLRVWAMEGWHRRMEWEDTGRPWLAPSPNMPTPATARVYPGACLVEATELSEGRGTSRPFQLVGAPFIEPRTLVSHLEGRALPGVAFVPTYFKPQFHKHARQVCGGVEIVVTDAEAFRPYRTGLMLVATVRDLWPDQFAWRQRPYEFVVDRPAIDLLTGSACFRQALEGRGDLEAWLQSWPAQEAEFLEERRSILLYPEGG